MVASAYAAHMARRAGEFGVDVGGSVAVDMPRVKARKDEISGQSRTGVESGLRKTERVHRLPGPRALRIADGRERWIAIA